LISFKLNILKHLLLIKWQRFRYKGKWDVLREKKWVRQQNILKKSRFYSSLAARNAPLNAYPRMDKAQFMENFNAINTIGIVLEEAFHVTEQAEKSRNFSPTINHITVGLSSGTSGNRGVFLASSKERAQWVAAILDRVIGISFRKRSVAFFLRANSNLYDSVKSRVLRFEFFDLLSDLNEHIERLNVLQPNILVAQPSMLIELARAVENHDLQFMPEKIISVAEVLYKEDKLYLETVFAQKIHQVYQCTEGFLASTCKYGTLHFHEDFFIIEKRYLDAESKRFHPVITDLERSSQPVIRYELNDLIIEKENCSCGSDWLAIEAIEGRSDDLLIFEDTTGNSKKIFPDFFRRAVILASSEVRNYEVIQVAKNQLEVFIEGSDDAYASVRLGIIELLLQQNVENIRIDRIKSPKTVKGNKLRRIRNEFKATP
jgi:putative adenylate-forming enzyme